MIDAEGRAAINAAGEYIRGLTTEELEVIARGVSPTGALWVAKAAAEAELSSRSTKAD